MMRRSPLLFVSMTCALGLMIAPTLMGAQAPAPPPVFSGDGLQTGIDQAKKITGVSDKDLRPLFVNAITVAIDLLGLLAAISIIICGMILIFSFGDDTTKEKAKKGVMYSVFGLIVILFAKAIVSFIMNIDAPAKNPPKMPPAAYDILLVPPTA